MKANELMMGDWVIVYEKSMPAKAKVEGVYGKTVTVLGHQRIVEKSFVEPIPLTPGILEKNFPEPTDGLTWFPEEGGFNCHTYVPNCEINAFGLFKYVHQLQHALRLCGIEKEIEL